MVQIPEYISKEQLDTDRQGMPQPKVFSGAGVGLEQLGDALSNLGAHIMQRQNQKQATKGNYAFEEAVAESKEAAYKLTQEAPENGEGLHDNIMKSNDEIFARHRNDVPADKQEDYDHRTNIFRRGMSVDASQGEYTLSKTYNGAELEKYAGNYIQNIANDPSTYDANMAIVYKYVDDQPMTAADKKAYKDKFYQLAADAKSSGRAKVDPEGAKAEIGFPSTPGPSKTLPIITGTQPGRQKLIMSGTQPQVLRKWSQVQGSMGFQAPIVSANRPGEVNKRAGGAKGSRHLSGSALDIDTRGLSQAQVVSLIRTASAAGFNGIGVYNHGGQITTVHVDVRNKKSTWGVPPSWAAGAISDHMAGKAAPTYAGGPTFIQGKGDKMQAPEEASMPVSQPVQSSVTPSFLDSASADLQESENAPLMSQHPDSVISAYDDGGTPRIGYGSDTYTTSDGKVHKVTSTTRITKEDADRDIARRTKEFAEKTSKQVGEDTWNKLGNGAKRSLTSVAYNYGSLPDSVKRAAQSGDNEQIASAIESLSANKSRRRREAAIVRGDTTVGAVNVEPASSTVPDTAAAIASGIDPAYSNMPYEWRKRRLDQIEAEEKRNQTERANEMKAVLDGYKRDSLAAYETHGAYAGVEPTVDMFLTANPQTGYKDYKVYQAAKRVALTVHSIATMDVSEARRLRQEYKDKIPKGEEAGIWAAAAQDIDAAVTRNEQEYNKKVDIIQREQERVIKQGGWLGGHLEEGIEAKQDSLTYKQAVDKYYTELHKAALSQEITEQQRERVYGTTQPFTGREKFVPESEKSLEEGIQLSQKQVEINAKKRVARQDEILFNLENNGDTGFPGYKLPNKGDFLIADPIDGNSKFNDFVGKVAVAAQSYRFATASDKETADFLYRQSMSIKTKVDQDKYNTAVEAYKKVVQQRTEDPFGFAVRHYENVREAWNAYNADPQDREKQEAAINLTFNTQKSWGMPNEQLSILPKYQADNVATRFKNAEGVTSAASLKDITDILDRIGDDGAKVAIIGQLVRAGVSRLAEPAIDAYLDKRPDGAVIRLYDAARLDLKAPPKGSEGISDADLTENVLDEFQAIGGVYYNVITGGQSRERFDTAVDLLTKAARDRMIGGEAQSDAVRNAIHDLLGDSTVMDDRISGGPAISIIRDPNTSDSVIKKGLEVATNSFKEIRDELIEDVVEYGDETAAADIVLPTEGIVEPGNIDINARQPIFVPDIRDDRVPPPIRERDMPIATEESFSREEDGKEILVPRVVNGRLLSHEEAWAHYKKTGEHLGKFSSVEAADRYAVQLHERQDKVYGRNEAKTVTKQKEMRSMFNEYMDFGVYVELGDGYSLFDTKSRTYVADPDNPTQPLIIPKQDILNMGRGAKEPTIFENLIGRGKL